MSVALTSARLKPLDALRGIAALGMVFWHYQHFGGDGQTYPYRTVWGTSWLYEHGWILVDFFFVLSGVVFTYKYLDAIASRRLEGRAFAVLRLSRLYPLHLFTLLCVAAIQWRLAILKQPPVISVKNDLYHFVLHLFMLHGGWFEGGFSFNKPSWSISTELFGYAVFYVLARRFTKNYVGAAAAMVFLGIALNKARWEFLGVGDFQSRVLMGFFVGSLLFLALRTVRSPRTSGAIGAGCFLALLGIGWLANRIGYDACIGGSDFHAIPEHVLTVFPLVIAAALTFPPLSAVLSLRPLTFLGDISYSLYLIHVPVQMVMLSFMHAPEPATLVAHPKFFWLYFAGLLVMASASHWLFEIPARRWWRRRFFMAPDGARPRPDVEASAHPSTS
jgi:peptidoglycan/LPS O-acetylase OafA/YrhL